MSVAGSFSAPGGSLDWSLTTTATQDLNLDGYNLTGTATFTPNGASLGGSLALGPVGGVR